jgi:hypothetical protein
LGKLVFARSKSNTARALLAVLQPQHSPQLHAGSLLDPPFPFMLRPPSLPTAAWPADCFAPSLQRSLRATALA